MLHESLTGNSPREPGEAPLLLTTWPWDSRATLCLTLLAEPHAHPDSKTEMPVQQEEQSWKKNMEEYGVITAVIFEVTSHHRLSSAEEKLKLEVICEGTGEMETL